MLKMAKEILRDPVFWKSQLTALVVMIPVLTILHFIWGGPLPWYVPFGLGSACGWFAVKLYRLSQRFINW